MNVRNRIIVRGSGFTLLEVVVAITIFAVCVSIIYLLYFSVLHVIANVEERTDGNRDARIVISRMVKDLQGLYMGNQGFVSARESAGYQGDEPVLSFLSTSHMVLRREEPPVDFSIIRYYLKESDDQGYYEILRTDSPIHGSVVDGFLEGPPHVLAASVQELRITYIDDEGEESETWESAAEEEGEEASRFPQAFEISVQFDSGQVTEASTEDYSTTVTVSPYLLGFEEQ